ncbi:MAG TPA: glycosyltransferase family 4 protein [Mycobacteriales bacterium]|nr:glycosyltransferase family 4 protein [Mycobacteriales bacterium]
MEGPLKIAVIAPPWYEIPPPGYGGVEVVCGTLVDGLVRRGHNVTLIGVGKNGTTGHFYATNDTPQFAEMSKTTPEVTHIARANEFIESQNFDIVHDHTNAGPLSAGLRTPPTIVTVHRPIAEAAPYYKALGDTIRLVAVSDNQRVPRPDLNWAGTVHNGVPLQQFTFNPEKGGYALWLARFNPEKGPDIAIEMCRKASVPLVLVGKVNEEDEHEYLENTIKPMLGPDVKLVLNADRRSVVELVRNAGCLIHSVRWAEPFGMVMIEAMSCGTPVLGLRRGAVPEVVLDGITGWVRDDPEELAELLPRVGELDRADCREHVRQRFSAGAMAAGYEEVYQSVIAERAITDGASSMLAGRPESRH